MSTTNKPTTQFSFRSQKELTIWDGYPELKAVNKFEKPNTTARTFHYSKYGHVYAYSTNLSIKVFDASTLDQFCEIEKPNVILFWLSPQGSYLATWERPTKLENGAGSNNLVIWDTKTGQEIAAFSQKVQTNLNFQWTDDEKYCARLVTGEIQFWESKNVGKSCWARLKLEGVAQFSLSPGKAPAVAVFIPEKNGAPAIVRMYSIPNFNSALSNKTFYKADRISMYWNDLGTNLLVLTMTDVDKSNKSYYGETNLYYLAVAGNFDCRVPLDKEGPIHDVTWGPDSKEFIVVYGSMPAKATLFDHRAEPMFDFGINPRNFVKYNPQGHTICIAGFGNLNGTVDLWDRKKLKKIATFAASNASHCEWSPCGRYLLTATLTPRLRVDNGFKLWHHSGTLIFEEAVDELYQIGYCPEPASHYPMRNISPPPNPIKILPTVGSDAKAAATPAGAYRPPHLRGSASPVSLSDRASALVGIGSSRTSPAKIVGAKSGKNGKKDAPSPKPQQQQRQQQPVMSPEEKQKKIRNLEKKLRQIRELKDKMGRGEELGLAQQEKVASEVTVMRELANLQL
ncbi:eukaryotic translation initiation factor eIF2A-domain-containing protein [Parasitella parasitica]|nr:eukaryotic translation initiation factor eIF2A-domain-containing protein [Parasitella parasitica]